MTRASHRWIRNRAGAVAPESHPPGRLLVVLLALVLVAGCGEAPTSGGDEPVEEPGGQASLTLLEAGPVGLDHFRGQWLFVNYWAEWCAPCLEEIPELNEFHAARSDARVLGINYDRVDAPLMREQVEKLGIEFPVAVGDPGQVLGISPPEVLPSTYVFDPEGNRVGILHGPQDRASLEEAMQISEANASGR